MHINKDIFFKSYIENFIESNLNYDEELFSNDFFDFISKQLYLESSKILMAFLHAYKNQNILKGDTPEERYNFFDKHTSTDEFINLIDELYPLLNKKLNNKMKNLVESYLLFKRRFELDKEELSKLLDSNIEDLDKCEISFDNSDFHNNSQSVYIIKSNNCKFVYKPRSGENEKLWRKAVDFFNEKNIKYKITTQKFLNREKYHWEEYIENRSAESEDQIKRLYYRFGVLSFLSYVFKITDLHMENVIADIEMPYIIDLETMCQVNIDEFDLSDATKIINEKIVDSVLSTQLFPIATKFNGNELDISGLCGAGGQTLYNAKIDIKKPNTDEMSFFRKYKILEDQKNIAKINDAFVNISDFSAYIEEGFSDAYEIVYKYKIEFIDYIKNICEVDNLELRFLLRSTNFYYMILEILKSPKYLKNIESSEEVFKILYKKDFNKKVENIVAIEKDNLLKGDIPIFNCKFREKEVLSNGKLCFIMQNTPLEGIINKIENLSFSDLNFQLKLIRSSLLSDVKTWRINKYKTVIKNKNLNTLELLGEAQNIAEIIIDKAYIDEKSNTINWLNIENQYPVWRISAQDNSLYSGLTGNALFFAILYKLTKIQKYKYVLEKILNTIENNISKEQLNSISVFNSNLSVSYLYLYLFKLGLGKIYLIKGIEILKNVKEDLVLSYKEYDIITGYAGFLLLLTRYIEITQDDYLKHLGEIVFNELISNIITKDNIAYWKKDKVSMIISGFSHGLSGISYALNEYCSLLNKNYLKNIQMMIKTENSYYSEDIKNWMDFRQEKQSVEFTPIHWCHGASGIGLSRIKTKNYGDVTKALEIVLTRGLYLDSDCLCHGNFGNIEFLIECYKHYNYKDVYNVAETRTIEIISERKSNYKNGVNSEFDSVNLMLGLSGIGYEILRVYDNNIPSILLLEV